MATQRRVNGRVGRSGRSARRLAASAYALGRESVSVRKAVAVPDWSGRPVRWPAANRWLVGTRGHVGLRATAIISNIESEHAFSMDPACAKGRPARRAIVFRIAWTTVSSLRYKI